MNCLIEITDSVHDAVERIRAIDNDYRVFYNRKLRKFELHHLRCKPTKQLDLPFTQLTKQAVDYVLSTRIEKIIGDFMDIENYNAGLEEKSLAKSLDKANYMSKDLFGYIERGGSEIPLKM